MTAAAQPVTIYQPCREGAHADCIGIDDEPSTRPGVLAPLCLCPCHVKPCAGCEAERQRIAGTLAPAPHTGAQGCDFASAIQKARNAYASDEIEIDDRPMISDARQEGNGVWVAGWLWVEVETCSRCAGPLTEGGDGYGELCADCADATEPDDDDDALVEEDARDADAAHADR